MQQIMYEKHQLVKVQKLQTDNLRKNVFTLCLLSLSKLFEDFLTVNNPGSKINNSLTGSAIVYLVPTASPG